MIETYPESTKIALEHRPVLHPKFQDLPDGISEFTFANIYLFREAHNYRVSQVGENNYAILGQDGEQRFFMLPFGLPEPEMLERLFAEWGFMKAATAEQARVLEEMGYEAKEDRDGFDYLYGREDLTHLKGNKFHRKKNLVNAFIKRHSYEGKPLLDEYREQAVSVLEQWRTERSEDGDYVAAREALERTEQLQLCGGVYYVDDEPMAFTLGEENALGRSFVIHFEKAIRTSEFKGIYQFVNQAFASILPEKYETINREQDLGDPGLRKAKESYRPIGFVKKYRVQARG